MCTLTELEIQITLRINLDSWRVFVIIFQFVFKHSTLTKRTRPAIKNVLSFYLFTSFLTDNAFSTEDNYYRSRHKIVIVPTITSPTGDCCGQK